MPPSLLAGRTIMPMKALKGEPPVGDGWVHELKWDGMRLIAFVDRDGLRLQSSSGADVTATFPELAGLAKLAHTYTSVILDGEAVAFAGDRPSFKSLQHRIHVRDMAEAKRRCLDVPVVFVVFDLLHVAGQDTQMLPIESRRQLLLEVVEPGPHWKVCEQHSGDLGAFLEVVRASELEGVITKRSGSRYRPGARSKDWLKVKVRRRQEFVVGGWLSGRGNRQGKIGSLLLGYYRSQEDAQKPKLTYVGRAGSGLGIADQADWRSRLVEASNCPFTEMPILPSDRKVYWANPQLVAEIEYAEWNEGQHLRHPVVAGLRIDKDSGDVRYQS